MTQTELPLNVNAQAESEFASRSRSRQKAKATSDDTTADRSARRHDSDVVPTSIRMNPGASKFLDTSLAMLDANRQKGEPHWSLGEVVELALNELYFTWEKLHEVADTGVIPGVAEPLAMNAK